MKRYLTIAKYSITIMLICLILLIINNVLALNLNGYGIVPRSSPHLIGIFFAPFLHGDFAHLASNFLPFVVLSTLIGIHSIKRYFVLLPFFIITTGLLVWLFARGNSVHIGMSGVIYALWGYLVVYGFIRRQITYILISLITLLFYGGLFFGLFPGELGVSFESHAMGALVGGVTGYVLAKR
ncbi:rhomboid family intramembrane serine protease [Psychromonas sp. MME2]|uniref:rhomboid family intramembrane serine protease n=1 Tax=unclassified Psychromonas TaxID=2614957 RepID=UPI00339CBD95